MLLLAWGTVSGQHRDARHEPPRKGDETRRTSLIIVGTGGAKSCDRRWSCWTTQSLAPRPFAGSSARPSGGLNPLATVEEP